VAALHRAVDEALTDRQRRIFVAIVLNGVPLLPWSSSSDPTGMLSTRCCLTPGVSCGPPLSLTDIWTPRVRGLVNGWTAFDRFLQTDPQDVGCEQAMELLHVYVELIAVDSTAKDLYPGIAAHLQSAVHAQRTSPGCSPQ
jgi:hypothetical protein